MLYVKPILKGVASYFPGLHHLVVQCGSGSTDSAEYCYGVWMRHLTLLWKYGLSAMPQTIAELGPGASLGVGLAALLSGVHTYYALDVVRYSPSQRQLELLDALISLFRRRALISGNGWTGYDDEEIGNGFPSHILSENILKESLSEDRLKAIRHILLEPHIEQSQASIKTMVPWISADVIRPSSVDVILSQAVLEHVNELDLTYRAFATWLKPGGFMSHHIDFKSHGSARLWNGHWGYSERFWKYLIVGKMPYFLNRQPCSTHLTLLKKYGFNLRLQLKRRRNDGIAQSQLARRWQHLSEDDLRCSGTFVIACKER